MLNWDDPSILDTKERYNNVIGAVHNEWKAVYRRVQIRKQVTEHGYKVNDVVKRLGITPKSLSDWQKKYGNTDHQHRTITNQQDELRRLKAELHRVTKERNILKEVAAFFASESKKSTRL